MSIDETDDRGDEGYFERLRTRGEAFDVSLLHESLAQLSVRPAIILPPDATVTDAMRAMQAQHRGCVIVTDDGTDQTKLTGIFTERDVLFRIVDRGRNPATLAIGEVMTPDPEVLPVGATVAYVLNKMSIGGFRHVPVVDDERRPAMVVSVRDVVQFLVEAFPREVLNLADEGEIPAQKAREGA